ncbi:GDSL esterase/lipase WDL1-like [Gastrolobium bilobum]|uniref:GDSL esterase/lipase WDL1-like n=1 Tax=Gastrolobium bilobum TaxID=150636 RepID=UPI002AB219A2|nr:GDSL esterase/lipase WDL1-like [Gastrolobium bilobum]
MIGPTRPQFVLFGSSIVQYSYYEGWGAILSHLYARKADIILRGYAAWNSRRALQVLDKIFPENNTEQPSLVIVYFGGNDSIIANPNGLGSHVPIQEYIENMRKIAIHLKSLSESIRIIFLSTPPINEAQIHDNSQTSNSQGQPLRTNESCRIYSEACLELCREMNIKAIDLWSAIQKMDNWRDVSFIDGIHLSYEGSKIVVKEILKILKEAEWEPSLHWKSMPAEFGEDSPYDPVGPDGNTTFNLSNFPFPESIEWEYN